MRKSGLSFPGRRFRERFAGVFRAACIGGAGAVMMAAACPAAGQNGGGPDSSLRGVPRTEGAEQTQHRWRVAEAVVADRTTGLPLSYASVYLNDGRRGTVTNRQGEFAIRIADGDESLAVSYVGYEKRTVPIDRLTDTVWLRPMTFEIETITVIPADKLTERLFKRYEELYRRGRLVPRHEERYRYYYRQTTQTDGEYNEVMEAFFNAAARFSVRDLRYAAGRYAKLEPERGEYLFTFTNFFTNSYILPFVPNPRLCDVRIADIIFPYRNTYRRFYTTSAAVLTDSRGERIYKLTFKRKPEVWRSISECSLYIDPETLFIHRCEGEIRRLEYFDISNNLPISKIDVRFSITYREQEGIPVVETVHAYGEGFRDMNDLHTGDVNAVLFNVGPSEAGGTELGGDDFLLRQITSDGYDAAEWEDIEIIKRTPLEERAMRMFEKKNLFRTY